VTDPSSPHDPARDAAPGEPATGDPDRPADPGGRSGDDPSADAPAGGGPDAGDPASAGPPSAPPGRPVSSLPPPPQPPGPTFLPPAPAGWAPPTGPGAAPGPPPASPPTGWGTPPPGDAPAGWSAPPPAGPSSGAATGWGTPPPAGPPSGPPTWGTPPAGGPPAWGGPPGPPQGWGPTPGPPPPTVWGAPGGGGYPTLPPPASGTRVPRWLIAVICIAVVACLAGIGYIASADRGHDRAFPDRWDSRVVDLVAFVERERGHPFQHPVHVNFLSAEDYRVAAVGDDLDSPDLDDEDLAASEESMAELRALGFVGPDFDLVEAGRTMADSGTLAFYDPGTEQVFVRGETLTVGLKVTLVHELTHVLQDQHFDLSRLEELEGPAVQTLRDVAEGDASRVEDAYVAQLSDADAEAYWDEAEAAMEGGSEDLKAIPEALQAFFQAPYVLGPNAVGAAYAEDGNDGVDRLLEAPPSELAVFDPVHHPVLRSPAADQEVLEVEAPKGAEPIGDAGVDSFAPAYWYLLLASRADPSAALAAVDAIEADGYLSYRLDGRVCVAGQARSSAPGDLVELLTAWAEEVPAHDATATATGRLVTFTTCDPGEEAVEPDVSIDVLVLPATRGQAYVDVLDSGGDRRFATCYAEGVVEQLTVEDLTAESMTAAVEEKLDAVVRRCQG